MINLIPFAQAEITAHLAGPHGTNVTLRWVEQGGSTTVDVTTGAVLSATPATVWEETVRGMIHYVQPTTGQVRQFEEVSVGDALLDLPPDTVVEGRTELEFVVDGQVWVQKRVSEKLRDYWDVFIGNTRLYRTVLVTLKG